MRRISPCPNPCQAWEKSFPKTAASAHISENGIWPAYLSSSGRGQPWLEKVSRRSNPPARLNSSRTRPMRSKGCNSFQSWMALGGNQRLEKVTIKMPPGASTRAISEEAPRLESTYPDETLAAAGGLENLVDDPVGRRGQGDHADHQERAAEQDGGGQKALQAKPIPGRPMKLSGEQMAWLAGAVRRHTPQPRSPP
mgnify:CR=1 FL=1